MLYYKRGESSPIWVPYLMKIR